MISTNENITRGAAVPLAQIEALTQTFSYQHAELVKMVAALEAEVQAVKKKYLRGLRSLVSTTSQSKLTLHSAIAAAPELFEKPRTMIFHGVKVGFQKGKGGIEIADEDKTLALIRKVFGADAPAYIRTTEAVDKKMLADMPVGELKKIGCNVADTGDVVLIKPMDSEVEKIVTALLKDAVVMDEK